MLVLTLLVAIGFAETHCDVAVIGGGSAGANAAVFLKDKGYSVCLFEKEPILGGHCETYHFDAPADQPNWIDLGVISYINTTFVNTLGFNYQLHTDKQLQRFLPAGSIIPGGFTSQSETYITDLQHHVGFPTPVPSPNIQAAAARFLAFAKQWPWLDTTFIPDPIPAALLGNFRDWMDANPWALPLNGLFTGLLTSNGMGDWHNLSMFYAMQHLSAVKLNCDFLNPQCELSVKGGCGAYYQGLTTWLGDAVYTSARVTKVTRPDSPSNGKLTVHVNLPGKNNEVFNVKKLIVAIPETLDNLNFLELDAQEVAAFADVDTKDYFVFEATMTGAIPAKAESFYMSNVNLQDAYHQPNQPCLLGVQRGLTYGPVNGWSSSNTHISDSDMLKVVQDGLATMASINPTQVSSAQLVGSPDPIFIRHVFSPFFPVSALARSPSPFTVINNLQGHRNTYYIGALVSIPDSSKVWEFAYETVNKYF